MSRGQTGEVQPGERQTVPLAGGALQLTELLMQGWVVIERQPEGWLLERLPAPPPRSPLRHGYLARPSQPPTLPPASVRTAPLSRR